MAANIGSAFSAALDANARVVKARAKAAEAAREASRTKISAETMAKARAKPGFMTPAPVTIRRVAPSAPPPGSAMRRDINDISVKRPRGNTGGLGTFGGGRVLTVPPAGRDPRSTVVAQKIRYPKTTTDMHKVSGYEFDPEVKTKSRDVLRANAGRANRAWGKTWGDYFTKLDKAERGKGDYPNKPTFKSLSSDKGRVGNPNRKAPRIKGLTNAEATTVWRKGVDERIMRAGGGTDRAAPETPKQAAQRTADNAKKSRSPGPVKRSDIIPTSSADRAYGKEWLNEGLRQRMSERARVAAKSAPTGPTAAESAALAKGKSMGVFKPGFKGPKGMSAFAMIPIDAFQGGGGSSPKGFISNLYENWKNAPSLTAQAEFAQSEFGTMKQRKAFWEYF